VWLQGRRAASLAAGGGYDVANLLSDTVCAALVVILTFRLLTIKAVQFTDCLYMGDYEKAKAFNLYLLKSSLKAFFLFFPYYKNYKCLQQNVKKPMVFR
jgi:hypothetical protein